MLRKIGLAVNIKLVSETYLLINPGFNASTSPTASLLTTPSIISFSLCFKAKSFWALLICTLSFKLDKKLSTVSCPPSLMSFKKVPKASLPSFHLVRVMSPLFFK